MNQEGKVASAFWTIPIGQITFRSPRKGTKKPPTEAQIAARKAAGERLGRAKKAA